MSEHRQTSFVDRIYEAAVVPELWQGVLVDFARLAGAQDSVLIAARGQSFNRWIVSSAEFHGLVEAHSVRFPTNERTRRLLASEHAGFVRDVDVFTEEEIAREPVFQDFLIPRGYGVGVATTIAAPTGETIILHAEGRRERGPISTDVVSRLDLLRPHFARAALLATRLEMQRVKLTAEALQLVGLPAGVLGTGGKILAANLLLNALMPSVVQDRRTRVALTDASADSLLLHALASLDMSPPDIRVCSIPVRKRDPHPPFIVHLVPVVGAAHDVFASASAILIVTPVVPKDVPTANVVQGLFDLTPAEAKLAVLIAAGCQPRDAAVRLGVTEETARTTLKRVLAKTGMGRQAELVGLLQGASLPSEEQGR